MNRNSVKLRRVTIALAAALVAGVTSLPAAADQLDVVKSRGKLICGVLAGFEPFGFRNPKTGEVEGFEPEVCIGLAKYLGVQPELKVITAQGRVPEIQQGRIDVEAALLGWTKERDEQVEYSNAYATVDSRIMVLKDSGIKSAADLATRKIGVAKGSNLEIVGRKAFPNGSIIGFDDTPAAYLALRQGKVAGLLLTETTHFSLRNQDPEGPEKTVILPEVYESAQVPVAMRKGELRLRDQVNAFLAQLESSGEAMKLYNKWFGSQSRLKLTRTEPAGTPIRK
ncbi:MAG TPA: transporter substrate-binding domain-containing protein [Ramlibacter sp.]|nr:transporter substrate-binding domain-containing protein [Ramlibacter sp.]